MGTSFTYANLISLLNYLVREALLLGGLAATVMVIFYGLRMIFSKGDPGAFNDARKNLIKAGIGALLIFGAYTIIYTVQGAVHSLGQ